MPFLFNPPSLSGDEAAIEEINQGTKWASGENQKGYAATAKGSRLYIAQASTASPDTGAAPTIKAVRTSAVTQATIDTAEGAGGSDGGDVLASVMGVHVGTSASQTQTVGVAGFAKNGSNSEENPDACGLYGVGRITAGNSAKAGAFGLFAVGRRDVATATATGVEVQAQNYTATPGAYLSTGSSNTKGIWLNANGEADSGVGLQVNNPFGAQFKVGIGFGNQEAGGKTGGVADSSIRDDGVATTSLDIRGTHTTAVKVASGAGHVEVNSVATFLGNGVNGVLAPHGTSIAGTGGVLSVANRAYYARFVAPQNLSITKIAFVTTVAATNNDACDVGIYNAAGERIVSSGATSGKLNATAGVQEVTVSSTPITAGSVYYAALSVGAVGGTAATIAMTTAAANIGDIFGTATGTRLTAIQATAHPLPATATMASGNQVPLLAVRTS